MGASRNRTSRISRLKRIFHRVRRGNADDNNAQQIRILPHAAFSTSFSPSRKQSQLSSKDRPHQVMSGQSPEIKNLDPEATKAAKSCGEWLRNASFRPFEKYEICEDNEEFVRRSQELFLHFEPSSKFSASEIRIIAIRFTNPATVPVKAGTIVDLIPVCILSDTPSIAGQTLELGQYVKLTGAATVQPAFCCLLLLSQ